MIKKTLKALSILCILISSNFASHANEMSQDKIEKIIENFLIQNPKLLRSVLDNYKKNTELEKKRNAINSLYSLNNPGIFKKNADITIFEFFDYNCGYCKSVVKTIMETISEDKKINFVFVEFPILSQQSYTAALAALASQKQNLYNKFHLSLMNIKGTVDDKKIFETAKEIGLNIEQLKIDMNSSEISTQLKKNREIAKLLSLNGTPAFIIGDVIYPGALTKQNLKDIIKRVREN
jgi:protein-disulfide isomerase